MSEQIQINNLIIKYLWRINKFQIIAPNKSILEEFDNRKDAIEYARKTLDYRKIARYQDKG